MNEALPTRLQGDCTCQNDTRPLVSVITTCKNAVPFIHRSVNSILAQTLQFFELIIVDDGSSDTTVQVLREFAEKDSRVRIFLTDGVGRGRALNLAIHNSRSDYVANLDADDEAHPQRLEFQLSAQASLETPVVLGTDYVILRESEAPEWEPLPVDRSPALRDVSHVLPLRNPIVHSSILVPKALLVQCGGYSELIPSQFDYELYIRLVRHGARLMVLRSPLTAKRLHARQNYLRGNKFQYFGHSLRIQRLAINAASTSKILKFLFVVRMILHFLPLRLRLLVQDRLESMLQRRLDSLTR